MKVLGVGFKVQVQGLRFEAQGSIFEVIKNIKQY